MKFLVVNDITLSREQVSFLQKYMSKVKWIKKIKNHDNAWNKYSSNRAILLRKLRQLVKKYGQQISKLIPRNTKRKWRLSKIIVFPLASNISCVFYKGGAIGIGFIVKKEYLNQNHLLKILIHEAVHINTFTRKNDCSAFIEILTCLITNKILSELKIRNAGEKFHPFYVKKIKSFQRELEGVANLNLSFNKKIKLVKRICQKKKFKD